MNRRFLPIVLAAGALILMVALAVHSADINVQATLKLSKDTLELTRSPGVIGIDLNGDAFSDIIQSFTVGSTDLVTIAVSVATNGITWFRNVTTNTDRSINIGVTNGAVFIPMIQLKANDVGLLRLHPTVKPRAHAIGGGVNLRTIVIED